ncbi:MAG TPA: YbhB/YbcL family Raf kinase inhibitor-like protein [Anaerolineae bacterium]|jgi:hypothetical protein
MKNLSIVLYILMVGISGCAAAPATTATSEPATATINTSTGGKMKISSSAFVAGQPIPSKYTCDGQNVSVPLAWSDAPANTKAFALITDDPDAPGRIFVHWVIFNIPVTSQALTEGVKTDKVLADGTRQGNNDASRSGYMGPCPPSGVHHYYFKLYALDSMLTLEAGATKDQLLKAMQGHILAQTEIIGTYSRTK